MNCRNESFLLIVQNATITCVYIVLSKSTDHIVWSLLLMAAILECFSFNVV